MLNDCKYGVSVLGSEIRLTLLLVPVAPAMDTDRGTHEFTYAFYPFTGPFRESDTAREALELNEPPVRAPLAASQRPILIPRERNIVVDTVKPADTRPHALPARVCEAMGEETEAVFDAGTGISRIRETDMLEENRRTCPLTARCGSDSNPLRSKPFYCIWKTRETHPMRTRYERMIRDTETRALRSLEKQNPDEKSPWFSATVMPDGVCMQKYTLSCAAEMAAVYLNPDSRLYPDERLLAAILRGLDFAAGQQHENGLFDYITCNFLSAPDTAFRVGFLIPARRYMSGLRHMTEGERAFFERMDRNLRRGGRGLPEGGFHTPNHRWAIASTLACCGRMYGEEDLLRAAQIYLNEGIDCNADGEYSEGTATASTTTPCSFSPSPWATPPMNST